MTLLQEALTALEGQPTGSYRGLSLTSTCLQVEGALLEGQTVCAALYHKLRKEGKP